MNEITCDICMDLIPLVKDGIASTDSKIAVEQHIENCEQCRAVYEAGKSDCGRNEVPMPDARRAFERFWRKVQLFSAMLLMFGIFFGLSLTAANEMFYNSLIMPVIGALGYFIFRWKSVYTVPLLLLGTHSIINFFGLIRGAEYMTFPTVFMWTFIYSIFVWVGILIAWLLHYAFAREK